MVFDSNSYFIGYTFGYALGTLVTYFLWGSNE